MGLTHGSSRIATDGLHKCLDAANPRSFPSDNTIWHNLVTDKPNLTTTNGRAFLYNGASIGGTTTTDDGGAIVFDGTDDVVYSYITYGNALSLSCWLKFSSITNNTFFATSSVSPVINFGHWGGTLFTALRGTKYNNYTPETNRWYNYVATFDTSYQKHYIDGELFASHSTSNSNSISITNALLTIGYQLHGQMSQALVYDQILSEQEILHNYLASKGRYE